MLFGLPDVIFASFMIPTGFVIDALLLALPSGCLVGGLVLADAPLFCVR